MTLLLGIYFLPQLVFLTNNECIAIFLDDVLSIIILDELNSNKIEI